MPEIPAPGTWVRLMHAGAPAGRWHHVVGWHPQAGRLQLRCMNRDRNVSWALGGLGAWTVARSTLRPDKGLCGTCRLREAHATVGHERTPDTETSASRETRTKAPGFARIGRSAWVFMAPSRSSAVR